VNITVPGAFATSSAYSDRPADGGWYHHRHTAANTPEPRLSWPIQVDLNSRSVGVDLIFVLQDRPDLYALIDWAFLSGALWDLHTHRGTVRFGGPGAHGWNYHLIELHSRAEVAACADAVVNVLAELIERVS
jgi:hypothetical protein